MKLAGVSHHSLRGRLLGLVLAAILLAALALATTAYRGALREADAMFDLHLQQIAHSLRGSALLARSGAEGDFAEDGFDVFVQIWGPDGTQVFRSTRAGLPPQAVLGFSDAVVNGEHYRVYSLQTPMQTVQIAQDMSARQARARALAWRATWPMALMAPLLMLAVGWIITLSLAPVARMRREVAGRADDDLSPLSEQGLPDEVRPLVHEINLLFDRVGAAFAAQTHFVADAAHELRSPLTALKLQAETLRRASDPAAREAATLRLQQGIARAIRLVGQLLALARQDAGGGVPADDPRRPVRLDTLVAQAMADQLAQAQQRQIDLGLVHSEALSITGQDGALQMLVGNLLDNALKYTPVGGQVDVSLQRDEEGDHRTALLRIEDSGPGIPSAEQGRAFDRFYRGAGSGAEGSGLGLAIVRAIAQHHGASMQLGRSERLGGLQVEVRFLSLLTDAGLSPA